MKVPTLFKEYIWLVDTIHRAGSVTLEEINEQWLKTEMSGGVEMARSTFRRHKDAIEDIFGIYIECDRRHGYRYSIGNAHELEQDTLTSWMVETLTVSQMLSESLALRNRILLEKGPAVQQQLKLVLQAMKEGRKVCMTYVKYGGAGGGPYVLEPYCIKLYNRRWYLLARNEKGELRVFGFDRMQHVELSAETFLIAPDFDAEAFFSDCFGVVRMEQMPPQRIVLRAFGSEPDYLRSVPLHQSQRQLATTADYTDFECFLRPTLDLCGQILSRGARLKVIEPQSLARQIADMLQEAINNYA